MDMDEAGYKFHMNDVSATMGLVGLRHSDESIEHRKMIAEIYKSLLKVKSISGGSHWLFGVLVDDKYTMIDKLREAGIESDVTQLRNDIFTVFGGRWNLKNMDELEKKYMYLPINNYVTKENAMYVANCVNEITGV